MNSAKRLVNFSSAFSNGICLSPLFGMIFSVATEVAATSPRRSGVFSEELLTELRNAFTTLTDDEAAWPKWLPMDETIRLQERSTLGRWPVVGFQVLLQSFSSISRMLLQFRFETNKHPSNSSSWLYFRILDVYRSLW